MSGSQRLLLTRPGATGSSADGTWTLPPVFLDRIAGRLQLVTGLMLAVHFIAWFVTHLVEGQLLAEFDHPAQWLPPIVVIAVSSGVFAVARYGQIDSLRLVGVGLAYLIVTSWCLPAASYWGILSEVPPALISGDLVGLSPVAVWILLFSVVVPAPPRPALIAQAISATAAPITVLFLIFVGNAPALSPLRFATTFVLPYILLVAITYTAVRTIYRLGRDVGRAREMGSYRLTRRLGKGGMGEVWRAEHNMLARAAAIKLIRPDSLGLSPAAARHLWNRFEREAQVTSSLRSPHTVQLYDFGVSESGSLYYVMELLDGIDLESLVDRFGPQPAARVVYILQQICDSLAEAHERSLVHRDIKPANLYLCRYGRYVDFAKVLDFGLVKRTADGIGAGEVTTTDGRDVLGTPAYLAPELAVDGGRVDGRADLYALGCVAFWLLTGRLVFTADNTISMVMAHVNRPAERPSAITELPIPAPLDDLVTACLAKDPAERPASADAMARVLAAIELTSPWTPDRAAAWWQSHLPVSLDTTRP